MHALFQLLVPSEIGKVLASRGQQAEHDDRLSGVLGELLDLDPRRLDMGRIERVRLVRQLQVDLAPEDAQGQVEAGLRALAVADEVVPQAYDYRIHVRFTLGLTVNPWVDQVHLLRLLYEAVYHTIYPMSILPKSLQNLIIQFSRLPGIGNKSASRLAFYLLKQPGLDVQAFSDAIANIQKDIVYCSNCFNMAEADPCKICSDIRRNQDLVCVVEDPLDVIAMAQIPNYNGTYHVLGGAISPLEGVSPENLKISQLLTRLAKDGNPKEIVLATNPSMEGEATAMFIVKRLKDPVYAHVKVTRLGRGLPMGADLEYADEYTLTKAMEGRQEMN